MTSFITSHAKPFVLSLSKHEHRPSPFDRLRANGVEGLRVNGSICTTRIPKIFRIIALWLFLSPLWFPTPAFAAKKLRILSIHYQQHFHPTDPVFFSVKVKNDETTSEFAEIDVTLSNTSTRKETTLVPVMTATIPAGQTAFLTGTYSVAEGLYSVSFPLFDGDGARTDKLNGTTPVHVGTETESIRVFPEAIHLGTLPPGRTLHPTPIEVSWSFFRFNQLRLDQPFVIRVYTDNAARYHGIPGSLRRGSPGGLVSMDGRYTIPIKFWSLNAGPDIQETGWDSAIAGPPPVEDDDAWLGPPLLEGSRHFGGASWVRVKDRVELAASPFGWSRGEGIMGQDPHDTRYVSEKNVTGDITLKSPFTFYLATETGATSVEGAYSATLVVELWTP